VQIIRKSSFTATPWKNGGGITHEVIRVPAAGDSFRWRVSVAHIDASGPFSDFAGYNRKMVLLRGPGVALKFADYQQRELRRIGDLVEFDGGLSTHCELLGGSCVDLNLMVRKSIPAEVRVERVGKEFMLRGSAQHSTLIFGIEHPLMIETAAGETSRLEPWDLAVLSHEGGRLNTAATGNLPASGAVFFATIGD
jgi:environmental stress-induced protein Ves